MLPVVLQDHDGTVRIADLGGCRRIDLEPARPDVYLSRASVETTYPIPLIQHAPEVCGFGWLCDNIASDEDPNFTLQRELLLFVSPEDFLGTRVLDFGCGAGGSTYGLAWLMPEAGIVGIEQDGRLLDLARARA
jgi:SAM-dependent methyltransferase